MLYAIRGDSMNDILRDDLMTNMAMRVAYMDCAGSIDIPSGTDGEYELSRFIANAVDYYINCHIEGGELEDCNFDEYIETAIDKQYAK
jgi:hypothetical protein